MTITPTTRDIYALYTTALSESRINPTTTSATDKAQIDILELLNITKTSINFASNKDSTSSLLIARKQALGVNFDALTPEAISTPAFYQFIADCYSFVSSIDSMPEILILPNGSRFDPLNPPTNTTDITSLALTILFRDYYNTQKLIEAFENHINTTGTSDPINNIRKYFVDQGTSLDLPNVASTLSTIMSYLRSPKPYRPTAPALYVDISARYEALPLNAGFTLIDYLTLVEQGLHQADQLIQTINTQTSNKTPLSEELRSQFITASAGANYGLTSLLLAYAPLQTESARKASTAEEDQYIRTLWNNIPEILSPQAITDKARLLHSAYNQLIIINAIHISTSASQESRKRQSFSQALPQR